MDYKFTNKWEFPDIFKWLQKHLLFTREQMLNTFNCGFGMLVIINEHYGNIINK